MYFLSFHITFLLIGSKIDFSNPKSLCYFSFHPVIPWNEHFHLDPTWLNPSCSSSSPTIRQIIAFSMMITYSHYGLKNGHSSVCLWY